MSMGLCMYCIVVLQFIRHAAHECVNIIVGSVFLQIWMSACSLYCSRLLEIGEV